MEEEEEEEADTDHGEESEEEIDEHVWTSPKNAEIIVAGLATALSNIDPENKSEFTKNSDAYIAKLQKLDESFKDVVSNANKTTIIFGDRFPFRYFADEYGLSYFAAFPGCSTEVEPSAKTLAFLIDKVNAENIHVILHIELSSDKMAKSIAGETGAEVRVLNAAHNISKEDFDNGITYIDLMTANIDVLLEALR
jgi:zinc transport system substrate-binding protein